MKPSIWFTYEFITPELAELYLGKNSKDNRGLKPRDIKKLVRDISREAWIETHQGAAFDANGVLVDGQHRLQAIIDASKGSKGSKGIWLWVARGLSREAVAQIDQGRSRDLVDALTMMGMEFDRDRLASLKVIASGIKYSYRHHVKWSPDETLRQLERHSSALGFAIDAVPARSPYRSTIRGLVARASYTEPRLALKDFGQLMATGDARASIRNASPALILRERLLRKELDPGEIYAKASRALRAFLDGENMDKLYATAQDLFPLPASVAADDDGE